MPSPPLKCALTSAALGPVTVNTPLDALYVKLPSPLAKLALTKALISELLTSISLAFTVTP